MLLTDVDVRLLTLVDLLFAEALRGRQAAEEERRPDAVARSHGQHSEGG